MRRFSSRIGSLSGPRKPFCRARFENRNDIYIYLIYFSLLLDRLCIFHLLDSGEYKKHVASLCGANTAVSSSSCFFFGSERLGGRFRLLASLMPWWPSQWLATGRHPPVENGPSRSLTVELLVGGKRLLLCRSTHGSRRRDRDTGDTGLTWRPGADRPSTGAPREAEAPRESTQTWLSAGAHWTGSGRPVGPVWASSGDPTAEVRVGMAKEARQRGRKLL